MCVCGTPEQRSMFPPCLVSIFPPQLGSDSTFELFTPVTFQLICHKLSIFFVFFPSFSVLRWQGRLLSCGMDDVLEQDQYEERLKEVFDGFDASGCGSLCPEELADLCLSLHLEDVAPALLDALLQGRDRITDRVCGPSTRVLSHNCDASCCHAIRV